MNPMKVMDWQTKQLSELPRSGEGNWSTWLLENGYELIDREALGYTEIKLYENEKNRVFAIYHPIYAGLDTESLYVNIPSEEDARQLMNVAKQLVAGMGTMFNILGDEEDEDED
ncbi:hypothetical protein NUACC21_12520 [Scytonema sp. NUACC21]